MQIDTHNFGKDFSFLSNFILEDFDLSTLLAQRDNLTAAAVGLEEAHLIEPLFEYVRFEIQGAIAGAIKDRFYEHFADELQTEEDVLKALQAAVKLLNGHVDRFKECIAKCQLVQELTESQYPNKFLIESDLVVILQAILFSQVNKNFLSALETFYDCGYKCYDEVTRQQETTGDEEELPPIRCLICYELQDLCRCRSILASFHDINAMLRELGLLELLSGAIVTRLIHQRIESHVTFTCKGNFQVMFLGTLEEWLSKKVVAWLQLLYGGRELEVNEEARDAHKLVLSLHKERLFYDLYQVYAKCRIEELFTISISYAECLPAIEDLKECLYKVNLRDLLVTTLKADVETRLLHPGAFTGDIIEAYIGIIKTLRILDPSNVLLERTCDSVHEYLRKRDNTVRCIVSSLTEGSDLADELSILPDTHEDKDEKDYLVIDWKTWDPEPVDAVPVEPWQNRNADIITMLVNIYGSKDLFVQEYQSLLADRILVSLSVDIDKEIRHLELLKLRFTDMDEEMHRCEVMLKDVSDSRRINAFISERKRREDLILDNEEPEEELSPTGLILSSYFWPDCKLRDESVALPPPMQAALKTYTKAFEALKGNRTLHWKLTLGSVEVEIEQNDRIVTHQVPPPVAAIIWSFQDHAMWHIDELSDHLQMPLTAVKRRASYWQAQGILKEYPAGVLQLIEDPNERGEQVGHVSDEEEEEEEAAGRISEEAHEEGQRVLWQYIEGMLINLTSMNLERMHNMLKMFTFPVLVDTSMSTLQKFMSAKVKEGRVECSQGIYCLPKP